MNPHDFEISDDFETNDVIEITRSISILIDDCLDNMSVKGMEEIKFRHELMLKQSIFWTSQDNYNRFLKDLREYANWLCNFIADAEIEFWGEEESS